MSNSARIGLQTKTPYGWWWIGFSDEITALPRDEQVEAIKVSLAGKTGYRIVITNRDNSLNTKPEEILFTC
jgi:hypothetical protein